MHYEIKQEKVIHFAEIQHVWFVKTNKKMNNLERIYEKFLEVLEKFFEHQVLPMQRRRIFIA